MIIITEITDDPKQKFTVQREDNETFTLELEFLEQQERWIYSISNLVNSDIVINGNSIVSNPNLLRQFKRILDFGISCTSADGVDPSFIDDFSSGRVELGILTAAEVQEIEDDFFSVKVELVE